MLRVTVDFCGSLVRKLGVGRPLWAAGLGSAAHNGARAAWIRQQGGRRRLAPELEKLGINRGRGDDDDAR